jgi:hypothetical protein
MFELALVKLEAAILLVFIDPNKILEVAFVKLEAAILLVFIDPNKMLEVAFVRLQEFVKLFVNNVFKGVPFWVKENAEIVPLPLISPLFIIVPLFVRAMPLPLA